MKLQAEVNNRVLTITPEDPIIPKGTNIDSIEFSFDAEWENYKATLALKQDDNLTIVSVVDGVARMPENIYDGVLQIGVIGENGLSRITTTIERINIRDSLYKNENLPDDPGNNDPQFWNKVLKELDKKQDKITELTIYEIDEIMSM